MRNIKNILKSFYYAFRGIFYSFKVERNIKIHVFISLIVILLGIKWHLSFLEWCFIIFSIFLVIITEFINTAVEVLVDFVTKEKRSVKAMIVKDIAAAAVLLSSLNAIIIGIIIAYRNI